MTLEETKKLLGEDANGLSDNEIKKLIEMIQSICSIVVNSYLKEKDED